MIAIASTSAPRFPPASDGEGTDRYLTRPHRGRDHLPCVALVPYTG